MSKVDKFWQYAEEAMRRAEQSHNEKEKQALLDLARTWTQAAATTHDEGASTVGVDRAPPEQRAP
jgi:hypothetical protein